jgi:acyl-CoA thioester hydrolase
MASLKKLLESKTRVQYQDCDPFNHLNNSRYIDYMMAARTEQLLEHYGLNTFEIATVQGTGWVSAETKISYLLPALWMEVVTIETRLIAYSNSSLLVEAITYNEDKTHIKAIMWAKLVHFDIKAQRSLKHSDELMRFLEQIHYPVEHQPTFEERLQTLKQLNQKL